MKTQFFTVMAFGLAATGATASGFDRSGRPIGIIFEEGNVLQFSASFTDPSVDGVQNSANPALGFGNGAQTGDVANSFSNLTGAIKYQFNDKWSAAIVLDEPYGADVFYNTNPASTFLGGTGTVIDSFAVTALARYKFTDRFSVHGGLRYQEVSASVPIGGLAFSQAGPGGTSISGFNADFDDDGAVGYVLGAAYEIPDIALRVSLTYHSKIDHDLPTRETIGGALIGAPSTTEVSTPESINLEFQTGIAANTLLFGSIRYARNSDTVVVPAVFGRSLTDLEDATDFEIGVGRRFNDKWSGSLAFGYQTGGDDSLVSPLAPTNGQRYISLGVKYDFNEKTAISGGIRYTDLGDAFAAPGNTPVADFEGNSAISAGFKISYKF